MSFCSVKGCKNFRKFNDYSIYFHTYPTSRPEILKKWCIATGRGSKWQPTKAHTICSMHFTAESYKCFDDPSVTSRKLLKKNAIPTINVHEKELKEKSDLCDDCHLTGCDNLQDHDYYTVKPISKQSKSDDENSHKLTDVKIKEEPSEKYAGIFIDENKYCNPFQDHNYLTKKSKAPKVVKLYPVKVTRTTQTDLKLISSQTEEYKRTILNLKKQIQRRDNVIKKLKDQLKRKVS